MKLHAPEFPTGLLWVNTPRALSLKEFLGRPVLLKFFTYSCINCLHVQNDVEALIQRFAPLGLVVIGIHSQKFPHEVEVENVSAAAHRLNIEYPIALDTDHFIRQSYNARAWPSFVLVDPNGRIELSVSGEGKKELLASHIEKILSLLPPQNFERVPSRSWHSIEDSMQMRFPGSVVAHSSPSAGQSYFVSDTGNNRVLELNEAGKLRNFIGIDELSAPQGLCILNEKLFICDTGNHRVVSCDVSSKGSRKLEVEVGCGKRGFLRQGADYDPLEIPLASPWDVAVWNDEIAIACAGSHQLALYNPEKNVAFHIAGDGNEGLEDGPALSAQLAQPSGLSSISSETLAFVDSETSSLRFLNREQRLGRSYFIETLVGKGLFDFGFRDGPGFGALMQHPLGCAYSPVLKSVLITDTFNNTLRRFSLANGTLSTHTLPVQLSEPSGVFVTDGSVLVADTNNQRILKFPEQALLSFEKFSVEEVSGPFGVIADFTSNPKNRFA